MFRKGAVKRETFHVTDARAGRVHLQARMWDQTAWPLDVELLSLRKHEAEISPA